MRSLLAMDTIQIETTNACPNTCANCTRFGQHMEKPYFMTMDEFKAAVDSMVGYPKMVGVMGGEPLIHPLFEEFCEYALSKIPREQLGLWTCFPEGYEDYAETICNTFGSIFLNDHSRADIYHHPFLVGIQEMVSDKDKMFYCIDQCHFQHSWSASINPNGAFFCEMAAAWAMLMGVKGWEVKNGWWWKTLKDFKDQIEAFCPFCGGAAPLGRRVSVDTIDDISPLNHSLLKKTSPKIKRGEFAIHDLKVSTCPEPLAAYKDMSYRNNIARRYGITLNLKPDGFCEPILGVSNPASFLDKIRGL